MTKFQDVWKLTALCRLFDASSFGASFPVSTKEFLWDLSLNVNLFFQVFLAFEPDEFRQNFTRERRGCESSPTKFQGVWKLTDLCRLFHSSFFRASFPVSTKEFLWDLSLNVNLFFQVFLAFKPDEFRQNFTRERRECESSPTPTPS